MLQWDLTETRLARDDAVTALPTEGELFTLMVAMLLLHGLAYKDLENRELILRERDQEEIARILEKRLAELSEEFGRRYCLRQRLYDLVGIRVTRSRGAFLP